MATYYDSEINPILNTTEKDGIIRLKLDGEMESSRWMNISKAQAKKILTILNKGK